MQKNAKKESVQIENRPTMRYQMMVEQKLHNNTL